MVEGHQCHRVAAAHRKLLVGKAFQARSPNGRFKEGAAAIHGKTLQRIECHGKNLFYFFGTAGTAGGGDGGAGHARGSTSVPVAPAPPDAETVVAIHFGMSGAFRVSSPPGPEPTTTTRLELRHQELVAHLSAMTVLHGPLALYDAKAAALGPDPLREDADKEALWAKLPRCRKPIGLVLMDQSMVAGLGNIFRAEVLFKSGVHPETPASTVSRAKFDEIWYSSVTMMQRSFVSGSIITVDPHEAKQLGKPWTRRYIYNQRTCGRCKGAILTWSMANRTVYCCPRCQPLATDGPAHTLPSPARMAAMRAGRAARLFPSHCAPDNPQEAGLAPEKMTVAQLRQRLAQLQLDARGSKAQLAARLAAAMQAGGGEAGGGQAGGGQAGGKAGAAAGTSGAVRKGKAAASEEGDEEDANESDDVVVVEGEEEEEEEVEDVEEEVDAGAEGAEGAEDSDGVEVVEDAGAAAVAAAAPPAMKTKAHLRKARAGGAATAAAAAGAATVVTTTITTTSSDSDSEATLDRAEQALADRLGAASPSGKLIPGVGGNEGEEQEDAEDADLPRLSVAQLRQRLRARGLPCSGNKTALLQRLMPSTPASTPPQNTDAHAPPATPLAAPPPAAAAARPPSPHTPHAPQGPLAQLAAPAAATAPQPPRKAQRGSSSAGAASPTYPRAVRGSSDDGAGGGSGSSPGGRRAGIRVEARRTINFDVQPGTRGLEAVMASAKEAALEKLLAGENRAVEHVALHDDDTAALQLARPAAAAAAAAAVAGGGGGGGGAVDGLRKRARAVAAQLAAAAAASGAGGDGAAAGGGEGAGERAGGSGSVAGEGGQEGLGVTAGSKRRSARLGGGDGACGIGVGGAPEGRRVKRRG